jgi:hypothetical protein
MRKGFDIANLTINSEQYSERVGVQMENKNGFKEQVHGSRKKLYVYDRLIASTSPNSYLDLGGITKGQFSSFLGQFNKKLYSQFAKNPELLNQKIDFYGTARHRNTKTWDNTPIGTFFYNIDLKSAYWQMSYRLGYIDQTMYDQYISLDDYKTAKRFCISFLARPNKMVYHAKDGTKYEIQCDTEVLKRVYSNIRNELYKIIQTSLKGSNEYIEYNVDGVAVPSKLVPMVKEYLYNEGLKFKTTFCQKINDKQFSCGKKIKNFRK